MGHEKGPDAGVSTGRKRTMTASQVIQPIALDQWTVIASDPNHKRFWRYVVRASTADSAQRVAWCSPGRPAWVSRHTLRAELRTAVNDLTIREMIRDGFVREVTQ